MAIGKTNAGGGTSLNFTVVGRTTEPANPKENTIWVDTDTPIAEYAFSSTDPFMHEVDHIESATIGYGYYNDSGVLQSYTAANPERYTEEIIPVEYGKSYKWKYTVSSTNSMWLSIMEYKGDSFYQRTKPVDSVSGTSQSGTYTPSSGVTGVRVGWRTFPDVACTMHFIEEVTIAEEGAVWILTDKVSTASFNALKKNNIQVYPLSTKQYIGGAWVYKIAKTYMGGGWKDWRTWLFKSGEGAVSPFEVVPLKRSSGESGNKVTYNDTSIDFNIAALAYGDLAVSFSPPIKNKKTLYVTYTSVQGCGFGVGSKLQTSTDGGTKVDLASMNLAAASVKTTASLDVSQVTADMYIYFTLSGSTTGTLAKVYDIWAE